MTGDIDVKKLAAGILVAIMLITYIFIGISLCRTLKASEEIITQTEASDGEEEAEALKAEYENKAQKKAFLMIIYGVFFAFVGVSLVVWSKT